MIKDEDVIKGTNKYMKPHEKFLYIFALICGIALLIAGIVLTALGFYIVGIILLVVGICEIIGVGLLLWTEGKKEKTN